MRHYCRCSIAVSSHRQINAHLARLTATTRKANKHAHSEDAVVGASTGGRLRALSFCPADRVWHAACHPSIAAVKEHRGAETETCACVVYSGRGSLVSEYKGTPIFRQRAACSTSYSILTDGR
jgi:hypothetical protein